MDDSNIMDADQLSATCFTDEIEDPWMRLSNEDNGGIINGKLIRNLIPLASHGKMWEKNHGGFLRV